jgi:hypothetical protein
MFLRLKDMMNSEDMFAREDGCFALVRTVLANENFEFMILSGVTSPLA